MAKSSILGGDTAAQRHSGTEADLLGPSDNSDSGSDMQGLPIESDADAAGTGERASVDMDVAADGADILPDRIGRQSLHGGQSAEALTDLVVDEDDEDDDPDAA